MDLSANWVKTSNLILIKKKERKEFDHLTIAVNTKTQIITSWFWMVYDQPIWIKHNIIVELYSNFSREESFFEVRQHAKLDLDRQPRPDRQSNK